MPREELAYSSGKVQESPENQERRETLERLQALAAESDALTGMFELDTKINETDGIEALSAALTEQHTRRPDDGPTLE